MEETRRKIMRIDKWLWAARFFKTRSLAVKACELGRVQWQNSNTKPSRDIRVGDTLRIRNGTGDFEIVIAELSEIRGPASVAQTLYEETEQSRIARAKLAEERRDAPHFEAEREGKPSKRDRRELARLRDRE